jgi:hypothetical protein
MKHYIISKNEMPTPTGISFFKMPHGILCSIRILPNTLRKNPSGFYTFAFQT